MKQAMSEEVQALTDQFLQYVVDHLKEFVNEAPEATQLAIVVDSTVGKPAGFIGATRTSVLADLAKADHPGASEAARKIRETSADEIPCLFIVRFPGEGIVLQTAHVYYVPGGLSDRQGEA